MSFDKNRWSIYQNAMVKNAPPHIAEALQDGDIENMIHELKRQKIFFARWSSDFDCGYKTEW